MKFRRKVLIFYFEPGILSSTDLVEYYKLAMVKFLNDWMKCIGQIMEPVDNHQGT